MHYFNLSNRSYFFVVSLRKLSSEIYILGCLEKCILSSLFLCRLGFKHEVQFRSFDKCANVVVDSFTLFAVRISMFVV